MQLPGKIKKIPAIVNINVVLNYGLIQVGKLEKSFSQKLDF